MSSTPTKTRSRSVILLSLLILLFTPAVLILARWNTSASQPARSAPSQQQRSDTQLQAELITATPAGFEPTDITRPRGRFLLAVDNRSGLDQLDLYLERETGSRVHEGLSRKGKLKWRDVVDLAPGHYVLRAAHDSSWRCDITLTPQ